MASFVPLLLSANSFGQNIKDYKIWRLRLRASLVTCWSRYTKTPEMLRQNVFTVKYRGDTGEQQYFISRYKSLLIGSCCHPIQLDNLTSFHNNIIVFCSMVQCAMQSYLAAQFYFSPRNVVFSQQIYYKSHRATASIINQVKLWPC